MNNNIENFIKTRLDILDKSKLIYKKYINTTDYIKDKAIIIFKKNNEIIYSGKFSLFGLFDINTKVWIWSWATSNHIIDENIESKKILEYGLTLEPITNSEIQYYIKSHLVNSRLFFENEIFLDIHLALSLYLSKAKFIYSEPVTDNKKLINYYLIY